MQIGNRSVGGLCAPLQGIRVIAVEQYIAGPYCSMLLADSGADVIKIEQPGRGDPRRTIGPFATDESGNRSSAGFMAHNRNKKSLALDLSKPEGREVFLELVKGSDVVVENLRPGAMEKLGLGYGRLRESNPRLIYAAISGFGRLDPYTGPYSQRPAMDLVVEAMSGIMEIVGFEDREPITTIYAMPDVYAGLVGAYSVTLALVQRGITGEGQFVDTSMYDCMVSLNERSVHIHSYTGVVPTRGKELLAAPRAAFKAADGYVAITCTTDEMWGRLARLLGREDLVTDSRTATGASRVRHVEDILRPVIEEWLSDKTKDEASEVLLAGGVPAGPVRTIEDVFSCPQTEARGMLLEIEDPVAGPKRFARTPVRGSAMADVPRDRAPFLGEHTAEVLKGLLGYGDDRLQQLRNSGAISG